MMAGKAKKLRGLKAKMQNKQRFSKKVQMKKMLKIHEEKTKKRDPEGAMRTKVHGKANVIKKQKSGKWDVPASKVRGVSEAETFKIIKTGKRGKKIVTKVCYIGKGFTRKPSKYERFIRPCHKFNKAHVTHPKLKATFYLPIIGVMKNPNSSVITKDTVIEVNISGFCTQGGKVAWGKYAQVTNNPENHGCINAVLLV